MRDYHANEPHADMTFEGWRADLVGALTGDVLEIGVGTGENLAYYRNANHVWGAEPDAGRAEEARAEAAKTTMPMTIDVAPAEALPYPDARFDNVVSSLVFCSVTDPVAALREIRRVLRPGGALHMMEHVRPDNFLLAGAARLITPLYSRFVWNCHLDRPTLETLANEGWDVTIEGRRFVFVRLRATPR